MSDKIYPIIFISILVFLWEMAFYAFSIPSYLLVPPSTIFDTLINKFWLISSHLFSTASVAIGGFVVGNLLAFGFATALSQTRILRKTLLPIIVAFQAIPIVAIAPFILIWLGTGMAGKLLMAALICYFPATIILTNSLSTPDYEALVVMKSVGASKNEIFRHLALPSSMPALASSLQITSTLATIGAVVAELAGTDRGAGFLIVKASYEFNKALLFAVLLLLSVFAYAFFSIVRNISMRFSERYTLNFLDSDHV